jgi:hypothetical protein
MDIKEEYRAPQTDCVLLSTNNRILEDSGMEEGGEVTPFPADWWLNGSSGIF